MKISWAYCLRYIYFKHFGFQLINWININMLSVYFQTIGFLQDRITVAEMTVRLERYYFISQNQT